MHQIAADLGAKPWRNYCAGSDLGVMEIYNLMLWNDGLEFRIYTSNSNLMVNGVLQKSMEYYTNTFMSGNRLS